MRQRIVIIGAGIVGASIAYYLSQRQETITVIDQVEPASGVSGNSFSWINAFEKKSFDYHILSRMALDSWHQFAREIGHDIDFQTGGCLFWTDDDTAAKNLLETAKRAQQWGYNIDLLSREAFSALEPAIAINQYKTGLYCRDETCVDAKIATLCCIEKTVQQGATLLTNTKVHKLNCANDRIQSIATSQGEIQCDSLILATGADTNLIANTANLNIPLIKSPGILVNSPPTDPIFNHIAALQYFTAGDVPNYHIRQYGDGHLTMGRGAQSFIDEDNSQENANKLLELWHQFLPQLSSLTVKPTPVLYRPMPEDSQPILGFDNKIKNLYVSVTHSGVTLAPLIGKLIALEVLTGTEVDLLKSFRLNRFSYSKTHI